jgi:hypothetical protein
MPEDKCPKCREWGDAAANVEYMGHTPGPWALMGSMPTNVLAMSGMRVARCDFDGDFEHPEAHANARLVAAVPEMLNALREADAGLGFAVAGGCGCSGAFICAPHSARLIVRSTLEKAQC